MAREKVYVRLATSNGRLVADLGDSLPSLHGHLGDPKLPGAQDFDLKGAPIRDLAAPHGHGLATAIPSTSGESVRKGLMGPAEVIEDFLERNHAPEAVTATAASVSMLPLSVKPLTTGRSARLCNLTYMRKRRVPLDPWAIERGKRMKEARSALGLSQAKVAELAGIKDRETIAQYESGLIVDIDPGVIPKLAVAVGMPPQQLSRLPWKGDDEAEDLKVSAVARQIAYRFDDYPIALQNHIRSAIASYDALVKAHGKAAVDAMYTPPFAAPTAVAPKHAEPEHKRRKKA